MEWEVRVAVGDTQLPGYDDSARAMDATGVFQEICLCSQVWWFSNLTPNAAQSDLQRLRRAPKGTPRRPLMQGGQSHNEGGQSHNGGGSKSLRAGLKVIVGGCGVPELILSLSGRYFGVLGVGLWIVLASIWSPFGVWLQK